MKQLNLKYYLILHLQKHTASEIWLLVNIHKKEILVEYSLKVIRYFFKIKKSDAQLNIKWTYIRDLLTQVMMQAFNQSEGEFKDQIYT